MLTLFSSGGRAYEDLEALLKGVDERLKIVRVVRKPKMRVDNLTEVQLAD